MLQVQELDDSYQQSPEASSLLNRGGQGDVCGSAVSATVCDDESDKVRH